jgi:ParB-like chromosome segregation protein Spo0J
MSNKHTMTGPVMRSLSRVKEWSANPRQGVYEGIPEMVESLRANGLQDGIHVWERDSGDYLLKGHRRFAGMQALGWVECLQVVHQFDDEGDAYLYLLQDHGHTVALNAEELVTAVEVGVGMGMTVGDLAPALGRSVERVQLFFDLGEMLPQQGREALADGRLSLHVAELLLPLDRGEEMRGALQMVLCDAVGNEPLSFKAAEAAIQAKYVQPKKWLAAWLRLVGVLMKKYPVADGYHFVEWGQRGEYVQGESGQPWPDYEFGDGYMPRDADGRQWQEKAKGLGVPVYVVPAPRRDDKFVLLVSKKMLRDAESVEAAEVPESEPVEERDVTVDAGDGPSLERGAASAAEDDEDGRWMKVMFNAVWEHLKANPTDAMTGPPWECFLELLVHLATDVDAGALEAWLGIGSADELRGWLAKDRSQRWQLRQVMVLLLVMAADAAESRAELRAAVGGLLCELGVDVEALEGRVADAKDQAQPENQNQPSRT